MKVIFRKPDLDTCLTALIMGVSGNDDIAVAGDNIEDDIKNLDVLCIEAGGSGQVDLNNFDHHVTDKYLPPACKQAYDYKKSGDERLKKLVEYVCIVDERPQQQPLIEFPSLSNIFSGMLLVEKKPIDQFIKGIELLWKALNEGFDPFVTMPRVDEWAVYVAAKEENKRKVDEALSRAEYFTSKSGCKVGFLESSFIGGIGALYSNGCGVAVMYNASHGSPPVRKFTIAGNDKEVASLILFFDALEKGWGGRETIIGSPWCGTALSKEQVLEVVLKNL